MADAPNLTQLITDWQSGDERALEELTPYIYEELRRLARRHMGGENPKHTLQATALVNEAFIRIGGASVSYENRAHFFNVASQIMRRILVDHARGKQREKRGGKSPDLTFDEALFVEGEAEPGILELDMALDKLAEVDQKLADVVQLIYFGGLTYEEAAARLGVSRTRFYEDLQFAKAWLSKELR